MNIWKFCVRRISGIPKELFYIGVTLLISFILFWCLFPLYSFDSAWYLSYLEYFSGDTPLSEWNMIRGFIFPAILWIAHLISPGSWGIEIVFCLFYMLWCVYLFKIVSFVKKNYFYVDLKIYDCILVFVLCLMNPILWGFFHYVLTEGIALFLNTVFAYYAIKFFTYRKERGVSKKEHMLFLLFSCIMTIVFWFLKQSFVINTVFLILIFELLTWMDKPSLKKFLYSLMLSVCIFGTLKLAINTWEAIVVSDSGDNTNYIANRFNMMRYIVPEDRFDGGEISVMNDDWEVEDTFEYHYENNYLSVLKFWGYCLIKYPERVLTGYVDNYLLMADVYQNVDGGNGKKFDYSYGPVIRNHMCEKLSGKKWDMSGEYMTLIRNKLLRDEIDNSKAMDEYSIMLKEIGYGTKFLKDYDHVYKSNIVTDFLTSEVIWTFTMVVYAFLLIIAPVSCFVYLGVYLKKKSSVSGVFLALSLYSFLFILIHVIEGYVIDRYTVPAYGLLLIVFVIELSMLIEKLYLSVSRRSNLGKNNTM